METAKISPEYRDWTYDEQADSRFLPRKIMQVSIVAGAVFAMATVAANAIPHKEDSPVPAVLFVVAACFGTVGFIAHVRSKKTTVYCSTCGGEMTYAEANAGEGQVGRFEESFSGESGRIYVKATSKAANGVRRTEWSRLMQGIRQCDKCRRFIVTTPKIHKRVANSRPDAEDVERQTARIERARKNLKGKKIVLNK